MSVEDDWATVGAVPLNSSWVLIRRLCETYRTVSLLPLSSRTFANKIKPNWVLCYAELRGVCRDANCPFQMNVDLTMVNNEVLQDLHALALRYKLFPACSPHVTHC